jgi:hypothetical protein
LETLADSGCNADIVGVTPVQLFYKSILGLSSGIYASTTICVFPARQALFVCAWKHRQEEKTNTCLTDRRAEPCKTNLPLRSSARISSAPSEPLNTPTPKTLSCPLAKQTHLSLKSSRCGSTMALKKSSVLAWIIGLKLFEPFLKRNSLKFRFPKLELFQMKYIPGILTLLALFAMFVYAMIANLAPENWYADKHDSKCEKLGFKSNDCGCYERFMSKGK